MLSFNAPHGPWQAPPPHLHSGAIPDGADPALDPVPFFNAMVEALDTELGRLLASIDTSRTTVIFAGDNGTEKPVVLPPFDPSQAKGTLYEGGLRVPLIVAGPDVALPGRTVGAPVELVDLYATALELAGVRLARAQLALGLELDSVSLLPYLRLPDAPAQRRFAYAERFLPNGFVPHYQYRQAIRGPRYKLIRDAVTKVDRLFDLALDPLEQNDLLAGALTPEQAAAYAELQQRMTELVGPLNLTTSGGTHSGGI
jgi:arylsulfatase A-like enzyme